MRYNNLLKEFLKYSLLNVFGMIGLSCYILADTFFISIELGSNGLAALNLAIPVYSFIHGTGLMLGMGGATKYSIFKSQNKDKRSNLIFTNTVCAALSIALLSVIAGFFLSEAMTSILGAEESIFSITNIYLKVILLFAPVFMMNDIMLCFVRNDGNPNLSMLAMLGGSLSNIILDAIFLFPLQMGIFGAVFATGLAAFISLVILSSHWLKKLNGFHLIKTNLSFQVICRIFSLGFPSFISEAASGIVMITFNTIILNLTGNTGVAAYGVIANLSLVVLAVYTGIAQGCQPLFSKAYGTGDKAVAGSILRYAMITVFAASVLIYAVVFLFADSIAGIFNSEQDPKLLEIASVGLRTYFTAILFAGFNIIISVFFTSTENALPAHILSVLRGFIIIVPMAFLLAHFLDLTGVWLAFPITELLVALAGTKLYARSQTL